MEMPMDIPRFIKFITKHEICCINFDGTKNNSTIPEKTDSLTKVKELEDEFLNKIKVNNKSSDDIKNQVALLVLEKTSEENEKTYHQVGHNDNLELMFTDDLKYDIYDLFYGDGKRKGTYKNLRSDDEKCKFKFYYVDIDEFVAYVSKEGCFQKFDSEIKIALTYTEAINKANRINCAEALIAFLLDCALWHSAPQSGEKYYFEYFQSLKMQLK